MKKLISIFAIIFCLLPCGVYAAEWVSLSNGLDDLEIGSIAVDRSDPAVIFAASDRHVYKTADGGRSWKQVLGLRGDNKIKFIYKPPFRSNDVYAATEKGLERSSENGKRWQTIFEGTGGGGRSVLSVAVSAQNPNLLWVGTVDGLHILDTTKGSSRKADQLNGRTIYSIFLGEEGGKDIFVTTDKGIYRSLSDPDKWERVHADTRERPAQEGEVTLQQFSVEEFSLVPSFSNVVHFPEPNVFYAASKNGIFESRDGGNSWGLLEGENLPDKQINFLARSHENLYVATPHGVFQRDAAARSFRQIYKGLESEEVRVILFNQNGNYLLAGTKKGLFRLSYPEIHLVAPPVNSGEDPKALDILDRFKSEPSIAQIQKAAIDYAEVHPDKIKGWRRGAALKSILPSVSFDYDLNQDQNVDLDRGGTADPDRFISGPEEEDRGWSVGARWDLSSLIWNSEQTSIDTRSRLMVELRDDVLSQVTHLYFERRRLQIEILLMPAADLAVQIERQVRIEELTAGIDGLTGGYLSKRLQQISRI